MLFSTRSRSHTQPKPTSFRSPNTGVEEQYLLPAVPKSPTVPFTPTTQRTASFDAHQISPYVATTYDSKGVLPIHTVVPPARRRSTGLSINIPTAHRPETAHTVALAELNSRLFRDDNIGYKRKPASSGPFHTSWEDIYDPYTGELRGRLGPFTADVVGGGTRGVQAGGSEEVSSSHGDVEVTTSRRGSLEATQPFEQPSTTQESPNEVDIWDALAKVRSIQSEVAKKHLAMEGMRNSATSTSGGGGNESRTPSRSVSRSRKRRSSRSSSKEYLDDEFAGRKEAINEIMKKVKFLYRLFSLPQMLNLT